MLSSSAALAVSSLRAKEEVQLADCHVYLGSNPFRQLGAENPAEFIQGLARRGVTEAWAGAFEGLLRRDVANVNRELAQACQNSILRPCGTVNLSLPNWQDDVKRCAEDHGMRAIRLHPNYHGYDLKAPAFRELLPLAAKHRLLVQLVAQMEDERTQNPQVRVAPVDLKPLSGILQEMKESRIMLLNANAAMLLRHLQECPNVWSDFAMIEGVGGVETLLKTWPLERLVFGSFAPVFYWESARLKMQESALNAPQSSAVQWQNAAALLA
ncbi:amidohydrolase family protein [Prosthecobacter sp.]|uniref:amidohydrolase family protein n=1 Tax=Prosthecobacter sp. TaxID=1965333 RepID=UPI002488C13D|nr:amidohydrolase family protein [Prosthecobacter sp.]MDI1313853.1 amidohydrolase family protein [Prosthecobacter sp.]